MLLEKSTRSINNEFRSSLGLYRRFLIEILYPNYNIVLRLGDEIAYLALAVISDHFKD